MKALLANPLAISEIAHLLGCALHKKTQGAVHSAVTSSGETESGSLFFALRGDKGHGIQYWREAVARGASAIVTDSVVQDFEAESCVLLPVHDTVDGLFCLARHLADSIPHRTVGITGSVGKTTTRAYVESILRQCYRVHSSTENHNNHIGVPMSMLGMPQGTDWLVLECGMNHRGELSKLSSLIAPDAVIITNIGTAHIGNLGSRKQIAQAKAELMEHLSPTGLTVFPFDEPLLQPYRNERTVTFSEAHVTGSYSLTGHSLGQDLPWMEICTPQGNRMRFDLRDHSPIRRMGALRGVAFGDTLGISYGEIQAGLYGVQLPEGRGELLRLDGCTVINDTYNASYESALAAFDTLRQTNGGKKIVCLGDMNELGEQSASIHKKLGETFAGYGFDYLLTLGAQAANICQGAVASGYPRGQTKHYAAHREQDAVKDLRAIIEPSDIILIKGSRASHMERIIEQLQKGDVG